MNPTSITLPIAELKAALPGLGKVINKSATLPVLATIRIDRDSNGITLSGTDLDTTVAYRLESSSEGEPTSLLIPLHDLSRIVKNGGPNDLITLTPAGPAAVSVRYPIGAAFGEQTIESLPVEEFPPIRQIDGEPCTIAESVRDAFLEALQCCSTDETRLILNGVYLDVTRSSGHYLVATDGRHLYANNSFALTLPEPVLIPNRKFVGWKPFAADGGWELRTTHGEDGLVQINSRHWTFVTRQIAGNYPNYRQVIPDESQFKARLEIEDVPALIQVLERMPCAERENRAIGLKIRERQFSLIGRRSSADRFTEVRFDQATIDGADVTVFLDRDYLLKALGFGLNQIRCMDATGPVLFSHQGRQMIVMPCRVHDSSPAPEPSPEPTPAPQAQEESATVNTSNPSAVSPPDTTTNKTERRTMPNNGQSHDNEPKPALLSAIERAEALKVSLKTTASDLNNLLDSLKQVQREQKTTEKEVQSVRSTLEKLQSVKL